jgi:hypothetical protein
MTIDKLIEAVEAGLPQRGWPEDGLEDGLVWTNIPAGIFSSQQVILILSAYNGSLDAAKALHDALLPGVRVEIFGPDADNWGVYWGVYWGVTLPEIDTVFGPDLARAWLLAILKAKQAEGRE